MIAEHDLNRVLIASCTPRTHEPLFQDTIREAGLNPYLFEFVNIRDQCSWVHMQQKEEATKKAKELLRMGIHKVALARPITVSKSEVNSKGLIIGGGVSGLTSALSLARQGFEVYLVEKESVLGGQLNHIYFSLNKNDPQKLLKRLIEETMLDEKIHVIKNAEIEDVSGYVGNFKTTVRTSDTDALEALKEGSEETQDESEQKLNKETEVLIESEKPSGNNGTAQTVELEHGIIIVATGADEYMPKEYCYGKAEKVITQRSLEEKLADGSWMPEDNEFVVMIQCVGSRNDEHPYCSRICCYQAIKNALKVKELNPKTDIFVLYRDIRTYGFREIYYREAREAGVIFIRYDEKNKPDVNLENGKLSVRVKDPVLQEELILSPDLLVLSAGIIAGENEEVSKILKVPLNEDRFFLEAHVKLRPLDFANDGIFLCGLSHSPKVIEESIVQAQGAAGRAATILSKKYIEAKGNIAEVNERMCSGCELCVSVCPYDARVMDEETGTSKVIDVLCQGCGACCVACLNNATRQKGFEKKQEVCKIDAVLGF
ncbi:MAG: CoB--CoM heterodisulfide reductase iron-sulfur subunit A family protein [Candidatus Cloacimonadota bacterium]|nr:MAG: CoB--CoM heterodisulfide reductase iron-sulfur subunit A family protein [Candidatus Cloacimonadota bacterium]